MNDKKKKIVEVGAIVALLMVAMASVMVAPVIAAPDGISEYAVISGSYSWLGVPYDYGGESKSGVDCSGLVRQVYMRASGRPASCYDGTRGWHACCSKGTGACYYDRGAENIRRASYPVYPPRPGDAVIFVDKKKGTATHVGIYVGASPNGYWDSYFIHAGYGPGKVVKDRLYYSSYYGTGWWYRNYNIYFARYNPDYWVS
ncbi:C40 family peptidase [Candidatus Parcubacteria bacterium]|nr:C40 family peptidase [Candidatus Parcubacteria bacterium]